MTREQQRQLRELKKTLPKILKEKIKKYKFKKKDYMIWFQEEDMFLTCLISVGFTTDGRFICDTKENIKPLWIDDLLWDFLNMSNNKKEPLSLRAVGAFTVYGVEIYQRYDELANGSLQELEEYVEEYLEHFYRTIQLVKLDAFYNDLSYSPYHDELRISLTLVHQKKYKEALEYLSDKGEGRFCNGNIWINNAIREFCESQLSNHQIEIYKEERMEQFLKETPMLNFTAHNIQQLITKRQWNRVDEYQRVKQIYNFVRDEILFGYNEDDSIPASKVLDDGYGQCNTKGTLFMALLRGVHIPCRIHGFTIDKKLQKGAMTGLIYKLAPQDIFHSWIEVYLDGIWYELEAFILDKKYLSQLQRINSQCTGAFCGYGVAVKNFHNPVIDFEKNNTYIQSEGINQDFGNYDCPDDLLKEHHQEMSVLKSFLYRNLGRHFMNKNIRKIRNAK